MDRVRTLLRAFGMIFEMARPEQDKKARAYGIFSIIIFLAIMVPSCIMVGYITYRLSNLMMIFGEKEYALVSLTNIISAFTMIFMMPVTFNVFYFSRDIPFLRSMPITPLELFTAKFWHTFKTECFMTVGVLLTMFVGWYAAMSENYGLMAAFDYRSLIAAAVSILIITVIPLIYCSIISILLVAVLRKVKRTSIFYHSSTALFVLFAIAFILSFSGEDGVTVENYVDMLVAGESSFNDLCEILFLPTRFAVKAMADSEFEFIGIGTLITVILYLIMKVLAYFLYDKGLYTALALTNKVRSKAGSDISGKQKKVIPSLISREVKVLMRTLSYRTNCVYANLIWPILSVLFFSLSRNNSNILRFISLYRGGQDHAHVIVLITVIALSFTAAGLNSIASTSFTREGAHIDMLKYLPVPVNSFIYSKAATAILFSFMPLALSVIFAAYSLGAGIVNSLLYLLVSLVSVVIAVAVGITFDSISPYTVWTDEAAALRGNINCFFNLGIGILLAAVICGICYLTYYLGANSETCLLVTSGILAALTVFSMTFLKRCIRKNIGL
ncbi:MAG: hypothetical protein K6A80_00135 [Saccharofermentans sp.]|nr:hypothetical protein [Saccharofermentans sp.]